jgi:hypothetical protein
VNDLWSDGALLGETHLDSEGGMGLPLGRGTGSSLLHHLVDLLQGETLGLGDQEVSVDEGASAQRAPNEEHLGAEVALVLVDHVGSDDGDDLEGELAGRLYSLFPEGKIFRWLLTQFQSQFEAVERATPRERIGRG